MVVNSQRNMVVALLSEKLRLLPPFHFSIRSWEGPKAGPDMAKVKPTVPDRSVLAVAFCSPGKEEIMKILVMYWFHSSVFITQSSKRFFPLRQLSLPPPIMCKDMPHTRMKVLNVRGLCLMKICGDLDSRRNMDHL